MKAIPILLMLLGLHVVVGRSVAAPIGPSPKPAGSAGIAVCIGLGDYNVRDKLRWAETDAVAVGAALKRKGYRVLCLTRAEATVASVRAAIAQKPTLIYFAGHCLDSQIQLRDGGLAISELATHTRVMLLDCCHAGKDLTDQGATVVFAAGKGYAFEAGSNGLFTRHLLDWIKQDDASGRPSLVQYVSSRVALETGNWQRPLVGRL